MGKTKNRKIHANYQFRMLLTKSVESRVERTPPGLDSVFLQCRLKKFCMPHSTYAYYLNQLPK